MKLIIKYPKIGTSCIFMELITEMPMVVKIYAISFTLKFLVLNLRMEKIANSPNPNPSPIPMSLSSAHMKKTIIPIRKKVNMNFSFFEYLK
jgi:hypothetical protein